MKRWTLSLSLLLLPHLAGATLACPMCKDSISDTAAAAKHDYGDGGMDAGLPGGFNVSVYYMLASVFATMGLVGFVIVRGIRSGSVGARGFEPTSTHTKLPD